MANTSLSEARKAKNDEFYTQYNDIEREMRAYLDYDPDVFRDKVILLPCDDPEWSNFTKYFAQNFDRLGIKKLISTGYAPASKARGEIQEFKENDHRGKLFEVSRDLNGDGKINVEDIEWSYLDGDGDFRSEEVTKLRDEADIIITNPPFSLFRAFLSWALGDKRKVAIIGNINSVTYKEVFPLLKKNELWLGPSIKSGDREFRVPVHYPLNASGNRIDDEGNKYIKVKGVRWFTNIEHGRRHELLKLMTMKQNLKHGKKMSKFDRYENYDNYDAIEIPFTEAIPSDYDGVMGVPITFLDKYCPDQFEILNANDFKKNSDVRDKSHGLIKDKDGTVEGNPKPKYVRILIRKIS